jgi:hypothetical protein
MTRILALATLMSATALPALAEGWTIQTLGTMDNTQACMDKARVVMNGYIFDHGGGNTTADTWSVYGFDLDPGTVDAVIMCPTGGGDYVNAILVLHSNSDTRSDMADAMLALWNE